jgi:3,5-epimerase/4-reductase
MHTVSTDRPRVLILGGRGYLGQYFRGLYPDAVAPEVDIVDPRAVAQALDAHRPEVVINCAGRTGRPNVDWCETHQLETFRVNVTGALVVMHACLERGAYLVYISSGCIYAGDNGGRGFGEDDPPNFAGSFYSRTKAWAEHVIRDFPVLTLRLRMPFDGTTSERNLIVKLSKYGRVLTAANSLTHLPDFFRAAEALIRRRATGVYNLVNEGAMSPHEVMERYRRLVDLGHRFEPLAADQLPEVARAGRSNCLLDTAKLRAAGLALPRVEDAVDAALRRIAAGRKSSAA